LATFLRAMTKPKSKFFASRNGRYGRKGFPLSRFS
jgi:hypothetical protein